jgi:hypothetical protein
LNAIDKDPNTWNPLDLLIMTSLKLYTLGQVAQLTQTSTSETRAALIRLRRRRLVGFHGKTGRYFKTPQGMEFGKTLVEQIEEFNATKSERESDGEILDAGGCVAGELQCGG